MPNPPDPAAPRRSPYVTREGRRRLEAELDQLWRVERPRVTREVTAAAAQGDRSENAEYIYGKKRLREIDRRVHFLRKRLDDRRIAVPERIEIKDDAMVVLSRRLRYGAERPAHDRSERTILEPRLESLAIVANGVAFEDLGVVLAEAEDCRVVANRFQQAGEGHPGMPEVPRALAEIVDPDEMIRIGHVGKSSEVHRQSLVRRHALPVRDRIADATQALD